MSLHCVRINVENISFRSVIMLILFFSLSGYPPFSAEYRPLSLHDQIMNGVYSFPARYWHGVSPDAIDLIRKMLTVDPRNRITIDKILCHRWLQVKLPYTSSKLALNRRTLVYFHLWGVRPVGASLQQVILIL
jgi:serine/threonine protein kinase